MEIKISEIYSKGSYFNEHLNLNDLNLEKKILATVKHNNGDESLILFSLIEIDAINAFLKMNELTGHRAFHVWLKENKYDYFSEYITDMDNEEIVVSLLTKLKEYYKIKN